jgi:hypothetical protein
LRDTTLGSISKMQLEHRNPDAIPSLPNLAKTNLERKIVNETVTTAFDFPSLKFGDDAPPSWLAQELIEPDLRRKPRKQVIIRASAMLLFGTVVAAIIGLRSGEPSELLSLDKIRSLPTRMPELVRLSFVGAHQWPNRTVEYDAILYDEQPITRQINRYVGSVTWGIETDEAAVTESAIRAQIKIPELNLRIAILFHRGTGEEFGQTHVIEIISQSIGSSSGDIADVMAVMVKESELSVGDHLAGVIKRSNAGLFIMVLSNGYEDNRRNQRLLKQRSWFDIPMICNDGRRAILAFEKNDKALDQIVSSPEDR